MGFSEKKFIDFIRKDRLHLVQAYVDKYGSSIVRAALDKRGRTAFHLSCRHASVYSFNYFLKRKPNLTKTDRDGNLAIHWAVTASKKGERYAYNDIILPLLRICPDLRDIPNKKGVTARKLLIELGLDPENIGTNWENNDGNRYDSEDDDDCYNSETSDDVETSWRDKLYDELQDDCNDTWGRYENDPAHSWDDEQPESFDSWTSRMSSEYNDKYRSHCHSRNASMKGRTNDNRRESTSSRTQEEPKKFETKHPHIEAKLSQQRYSLMQRKCKFMMKYAKLFENRTNTTITIDDLPWIGITISAEEILAMLLVDIDTSDFAAQKKCLREQQRTWHPDKFLQKFGSRLGPNDKDSIIAEVNRFSQIINSTLDNISPI